MIERSSGHVIAKMYSLDPDLWFYLLLLFLFWGGDLRIARLAYRLAPRCVDEIDHVWMWMWM